MSETKHLKQGKMSKSFISHTNKLKNVDVEFVCVYSPKLTWWLKPLFDSSLPILTLHSYVYINDTLGYLCVSYFNNWHFNKPTLLHIMQESYVFAAKYNTILHITQDTVELCRWSLFTWNTWSHGVTKLCVCDSSIPSPSHLCTEF